MRKSLLTAALVACFSLPLLSSAAEQGGNTVHPEIGTKTPNVLLSKDILALPEREKLAWIHGAVSLMAQTAARQEGSAARCVMDWYFKLEETPAQLLTVMSQLPEKRASSVIFTAASLACEEL